MSKNNIILMGPPGTGKTTVSKILSKKLNLPAFDIDDHHLEVVWRKSVGEVLAEVGDDMFLELEGKTTMQLEIKDAVIALTGSNPLHENSMKHIQQMGTVIFLDTYIDAICERLQTMKVERIVGMKGKTLKEVLEYRQSFYEKYYDLRIIISEGETPEEVADKIITELKRDQAYVSTRGGTKAKTFLQVVKQGLAEDRGLFVPKSFPKIQLKELQRILPFSYQERALRVLEKFPLGSFHPQSLRRRIEAAYGDRFEHSGIVPIRHLEGKQYLLELYHGPTAAFKDLALQLVPKIFSKSIEGDGKKYLILAATSGDTGIASIEGYKTEPNTSVMVLYPKNGVSEIQKKQMISAHGNNVFVLGVDADFDFCQKTVKDIFSDGQYIQELDQTYNTRLSSANSINWGRLIPQVAYYFSAYLDLINSGVISLGDSIDVAIPCGNFGNMLAAFYAENMGLPIGKYIVASNENNALSEFFRTGIYDIRGKHLVQTTSPSIDILKSSNIERFIYMISGENAAETKKYMENLEQNGYFEVSPNILQTMQKKFVSGFANEHEVKNTIKQVFDRTQCIIDTHTAVAKKVADEYPSSNTTLIASTAHYAKFAPAMVQALSDSPEKYTTLEQMFEYLESLNSKTPIHEGIKKVCTIAQAEPVICGGSKEEIQNILEKFLAS